MVKALTFAGTAGLWFLGITLWTNYQKVAVERVAVRPAHEIEAELSGPEEWRALHHRITASRTLDLTHASRLSTQLTPAVEKRDILDPDE
uniref:Uncharacterized protein n=1 Tax=Bicosoecida sp. CB-2014 TaxID=1486930 RepID=A0A7S1CFG2_9STRA